MKMPPRGELQNLYDQNKTQTEIGQVYGVSQKVIFGWFKRLAIVSRVAKKRNQKGESNSSWKGDNATYAAFHYRVKAAKGKAFMCEACGRSDSGINYDWANQTGHYENIDDYRMMCRSCHFKKDGHRHNLPNRTRNKNANQRKIIDGK